MALSSTANSLLYPGGTLGTRVTGVGGSSQSNVAASQNTSNAQSSGTSQGSSFSQTYIPDYQESPILRSVALQAQQMAPQVYDWGMQQYNKNQGNIDAMMRNAMTYASPQRIAASMGSAMAGVQQGAEAGRQSAIKDLQSFGIDPSSGRYGALDQASRVMAGAQSAGAGNVQRDKDIATGWGMQTQAQDASNKNYATGYGASQQANALLGTAMQLKYPPLGTTAGSQNTASNQSSTVSQGTSSQSGGTESYNASYAPPNPALTPGSSLRTLGAMGASPGVSQTPHVAQGGPIYRGMQAGGPPPDDQMGDQATTGGFVSDQLSPSNGGQTDDVQAQLNAGEFVIPKDVAQWKGQEFFYKLMAQARAMRATAGQETGNNVGYQNGGNQPPPNQGFARGGDVEDQAPRRRFDDGYQVAGDVVPLPISPGPQAGNATRSERESAVLGGVPRISSPGMSRAMDMGQQWLHGLHPRGYARGGPVGYGVVR